MFTLNCKGKLWRLDSPQVMGILNATPDSFYQGQLAEGIAGMTQRAVAMAAAGATIVDIGGQSTRPGSEVVSVATELDRVIPLIRSIREQLPELLLSIDTYYSEVAAEAVAAGADMVNDISAGQFDPNMLSTVAALQTPYIAMHIQGTPQTMQQAPHYTDVVTEVLDYCIAKQEACRQAGIKDLVLDPGFGFGKTITHNYTLLRRLSALQITGLPILVGLSRKSMIWKKLSTSAAEALNGTSVLHTVALLQGAHILRVHDVKEAVETIRLVAAVKADA